MNKRPSTKNGTLLATRANVTVFELLGGQTYHNVGFTKDQITCLRKIYGFQDRKGPPKEGENFYVTHVWVMHKHQEACARVLKGLSLVFSAEGTRENKMDFKVLIPRNFPGLRIQDRDIPNYEEYTLRSWADLHQEALDVLSMHNTGDTRNLFRHAESDGLRLMAFLSQFVEPGEDPVRMVASALAEQGYDVCLDEEDEEELRRTDMMNGVCDCSFEEDCTCALSKEG